jgi:hypothetical protein
LCRAWLFAESRFRVSAEWPGCDGTDPWESPHAAEHAGTVGPGGGNGPLGKRGKPKPELVFSNRVNSESFSYDSLGNRVASDDDLPAVELRNTDYGTGDYTRNDKTETRYLMAGGERLRKVVSASLGAPALSGGMRALSAPSVNTSSTCWCPEFLQQ